MSLERRGKRKYYYRSRRRGSRVFKDYLGKVDEADVAAKEDAEKKRLAAEEARRRKAAERAFRAEIRETERTLDVLRIISETLIEVQMIAAGYHRHDRGPWRKKRVATRSPAT
jgi:hypothetical protein